MWKRARRLLTEADKIEVYIDFLGTGVRELQRIGLQMMTPKPSEPLLHSQNRIFILFEPLQQPAKVVFIHLPRHKFTVMCNEKPQLVDYYLADTSQVHQLLLSCAMILRGRIKTGVHEVLQMAYLVNVGRWR